MVKPVELTHHCFSFFRIKTCVEDVEGDKLWRQEVEMSLPLLQGGDGTGHLLPSLPQMLNLLKEGDRRTAIYLVNFKEGVQC